MPIKIIWFVGLFTLTITYAASMEQLEKVSPDDIIHLDAAHNTTETWLLKLWAGTM